MPIVRDGYIRYSNGIYRDIDGKLGEYEGRRVLVVDGWKPGEVLLTSLTKKFICHAIQINTTEPDLLQKEEEYAYEVALRCLHRIVVKKEGLNEALCGLQCNDKDFVRRTVESLLKTPDGAGNWEQSRDRVWWNIYREGDRWELLCVVKKKRINKFIAFSYWCQNGMTKRYFHGRFLSLQKAQRIALEKAHRRSRWIPANERKQNALYLVDKSKGF
jgi:hypothetical protein